MKNNSDMMVGKPELLTATKDPAYNMRKDAAKHLQTSLNEEDIQQKKWEAQGIQLEHDSDADDGDGHSASCDSSPSRGGLDTSDNASPTKNRKKLNTADRKNMSNASTAAVTSGAGSSFGQFGGNELQGRVRQTNQKDKD